jgi:hypothetical protein
MVQNSKALQEESYYKYPELSDKTWNYSSFGEEDFQSYNRFVIKRDIIREHVMVVKELNEVMER